MKHKRFNEVFPYTYYIERKSDLKKYHGIRYSNFLSLDKSPLEDFSIIYFSSGEFAQDFKNNPEKYTYRLCWTFDSVEEAIEHEKKVNTKLMKKDNWAVYSNGKAILQTDEVRAKIGKANTGKPRSIKQRNDNSKRMKSLVDAGTHHWKTEEHRIKTSKRMKENNPSFGGLSVEHKIKIGVSCSKALLGVSKSEAHKRNMSLCRLGNEPWNKGRKSFLCNNGTKNISVFDGEEIPEGFIKGKLKKEDK